MNAGVILGAVVAAVVGWSIGRSRKKARAAPAELEPLCVELEGRQECFARPLVEENAAQAFQAGAMAPDPERAHIAAVLREDGYPLAAESLEEL